MEVTVQHPDLTIDCVGNLRPPKIYRGHTFMDMPIDALPVGLDPLTQQKIYWGDGHEIACVITEDHPSNQEIPF